MTCKMYFTCGMQKKIEKKSHVSATS